MAQQGFPIFCDQPGLTIRNFAIDGSAVGATSGIAGLDKRGQFLCEIKKTTNVVTIDWNQSFGDIPYVFVQPAAGQTNTLVEVVTNTASQLVIRTVEADSNATGVNDADLMVVVCSYNTTSVFS